MYLKVEVIRKSCVFVLQIEQPTNTLRRLAMFFADRGIELDNLQMHRFRTGEAMLIVHCSIEKKRIEETVQLLEQMPGITELQKMEGN